MLCPHLHLSSFSLGRHLCVSGTQHQVWQELLYLFCKITIFWKKKKKELLYLVFGEFFCPTISTSLTDPFSSPTQGGGGERLPWPAPAWSRALGIFNSLGGLLVRGAQVFNLPCQPCFPSPPRKVYGQLGAGLLMQPQSSTRRAPALISCPSLSCNRRFFNRVGSSHAQH